MMGSGFVTLKTCTCNSHCAQLLCLFSSVTLYLPALEMLQYISNVTGGRTLQATNEWSDCAKTSWFAVRHIGLVLIQRC